MTNPDPTCGALRRTPLGAQFGASWRALALGALLQACGGTSYDPSAGNGTPRSNVLPSVCQPVSELTEEPELTVDDFEDGDAILDKGHSLHGVWYVANDDTGTQEPAVRDDPRKLLVGDQGTAASPAYALHTSGQGFTHWGAFVGARLNAAGSHVCSYDLSGYTGIELSVRGEGSMRINLGTAATTPIVDGGACTATSCSDYGRSVPLAPEWQGITIPFADLTQPSWASAAPWEPGTALRISFWAERGDFDFWLDEIRFYR